MSEESGSTVRIERTFDASAEEVFDAWTSPEVMRRWFHCAPDWDTPEALVDLRVGGKVRVVMRRPDGTEVTSQGEYAMIDRPHRLALCPDVLAEASDWIESQRARWERLFDVVGEYLEEQGRTR